MEGEESFFSEAGSSQSLGAEEEEEEAEEEEEQGSEAGGEGEGGSAGGQATPFQVILWRTKVF